MKVSVEKSVTALFDGEDRIILSSSDALPACDRRTDRHAA